ncbi:MAG: phosphatase PAP2 family protein, partial [Candidatus Rokuibacteriota bacterium]
MIPASPLIVLLLAISVFIALSAAVMAAALPGEAEVRQALLSLASPSVIAALEIVNFAGDWRLLIPAALVLFLAFPTARARWGVWVGLMIATPLVESAAKFLVGRTRPEELSLGFPSGHVSAAAAFFGAVGYLAATLPSPGARLAVRTGAVAVVVLVAVARVLLRAHWPSDAVGGALLGLALASAAALVAQGRPG